MYFSLELAHKEVNIIADKFSDFFQFFNTVCQSINLIWNIRENVLLEGHSAVIGLIAATH